RLPFSSATFREHMMTVVTPSFLEELKVAADRAAAVEAQYRQEAAHRISQLETERAFAFRRLNLMKAVTGAVAPAENDDAAVAGGLALLRERLNWSTVDEAREEVLLRFTPVVVAVRREVAPPQDSSSGSVADALAEFEAAYLDRRGNSFWLLFEQQLPELPLVE